MPTWIDWNALSDDCVAHLQALLRIDTVNPPSYEAAAAAYLADTIRADGIAVEGADGRGNAVARLHSGSPVGRPLMLTGHTDVVSVERAKWSRDPFGGELVDGYLWGRGALDDTAMARGLPGAAGTTSVGHGAG